MKAINLCVSTALICVLSAAGLHADYNAISLVSGTTLDTTTNGDVGTSFDSPDGNLVVFTSDATNLVSNDTNGKSDVFLKNITTGAITLISVGTNAFSANGTSSSPRISSDGSTIVFVSDATNLVTLDTNGKADVFSYTVSSGAISLVSVSSAEVQANADSNSPAISADGNIVVFSSTATNLDTLDTNDREDIFLRNISASSTDVVSLNSSGVQGNQSSSKPLVSADGNIVVFLSQATNLVDEDDNGVQDIFKRNISAATTTLVTRTSAAGFADNNSSQPAISSDGRYVAFVSQATNLVTDDTNDLSDVFLRDTTGESTSRISLGFNVADPNGESTSPAISDNGRHIAFISSATNIIDGDINSLSDAFVYDRTAGSAARVSVNSAGFVGNRAPFSVGISADAKHVFFTSAATDLTDDDRNAFTDLYRINIECLVDLGSAPSTDTDSDSVLNCDEDCGADPAKTVAGVCGCGVADSDSDADATLDCNDGCPSNASKVSEGSCGCAVADVDTNGNSVADCLDPTSSSVPRAALAYVRGKNVTIIFPGDFTGVQYTATITRRGKAPITRRSNKEKLRLKLNKGRYQLTYTATLGGTTTLASPILSFRVK